MDEVGLVLAKRLWNWEPHSEGQRDWLLCNAKIKVAACGRRWGKSESLAIDVCAHALAHAHSIQMILAPTDDQTKIIMNEVRRRLYGIPGLADRFEDKLSPYPLIEFKGAAAGAHPTTIMARTVGTDGKGIRGRKAHRVIVDEAAFIDDNIMQAVVTPLLADYDGQLVLASTPSGRNHFYETYMRGMDPQQSRCRSFQFPSSSNPYLPAAYLESEQETKPERVWRVEYLAEFADAEGTVFRGVRLCANALPQPPAPQRLYCIGVDLGKYEDFTVLTVIDSTPGQPRNVVWIERFNKIDWSLQKLRICELSRKYNLARVLVETNYVGDAILEELVRAGVPATGFATTAHSKPDLIDALAVAIEQRLIAYPSDPALIGELESYAYERTPLGYLRMAAASGHDDCVISLALAWRLANAAKPGHAIAGGVRSVMVDSQRAGIGVAEMPSPRTDRIF